MYILASVSPRRKELLKLAVGKFEVIPSGCEETVPENIPPEKIPEYLARLKACDVAEKYPRDTVVGADTMVFIGGMLLGKPKDRPDAVRMLKLLSGTTHKVITGCAVCEKGDCRSFSYATEVTFYELGDDEISAYADTSEPYDKAGGYGIQGTGTLFVKEIRGDYFNVVGLPVAALKRFLYNKTP